MSFKSDIFSSRNNFKNFLTNNNEKTPNIKNSSPINFSSENLATCFKENRKNAAKKVMNFNFKEVNLYEILNISTNSNKDEIKKAYKKLCLKFHPDKVNKNEVDNENFIKINKAYKILIDDELRNIYDEMGIDAVKLAENYLTLN